ncbi:hypothetical protein ABT247_04880 [Kitasatospora sp. NPDC001539]|uniref:hypothetical protein n=1 Tax=Kitasatospora sp. NPDC001539 TaxID=3154384 RepID=UPI003326F8AF
MSPCTAAATATAAADRQPQEADVCVNGRATSVARTFASCRAVICRIARTASAAAMTSTAAS